MLTGRRMANLPTQHADLSTCQDSESAGVILVSLSNTRSMISAEHRYHQLLNRSIYSSSNTNVPRFSPYPGPVYSTCASCSPESISSISCYNVGQRGPETYVAFEE